MSITDNKPVRLLRNAGVVGGTAPTYLIRPRNAMLLSTTNKCIAVLMDPNDSAAPAGGYGDATNVTKIYVYESTDRDTWTLINTLSVTNAMDKSATYDPIYACTIGSAGQVYVAYRATGGTLRCIGLTANTYTQSEDKLVAAAVTGGMWTALDMDTINAPTGGVAPVLIMGSYIKTATANDHIGYGIYHRRFSDGTWLNEKTQATDPGNAVSRDVNSCSMCSIEFMNGSASNTTVRFAYAFNVMDTNTDQGFGLQTATLDATSGGMTAVATIFGYGASKNTISRVNIPNTIVQVFEKHRQLDIFPANATGDLIVANTQYYAPSAVRMFSMRYTFTGTVVNSPTSFNSPSSTSGVYPATYSNGMLVFHYGSSSMVYAQLNKDGTWLGSYNFTNQTPQPDVTSGNTYYHGTDSAGWDTRVNQDMLALVSVAVINTPKTWTAYPLPPMPGPKSVTPAAGSTQTTSTPDLSAIVDINMHLPQSRHKILWQLASTSDFLTQQRNYLQADARFGLITGTDNSAITYQFYDYLPLAQQLSTTTTWYIHGAMVDEYGRQGYWSTSQTFTVSHPPSATTVTPFGTVIYGTGVIAFNWTTSDPYPNDYQTAYQVVVEKNSDGSVVYDSGKVTSAVKTHYSSVIASANKDIQLRWKVRAWDMDDEQGAYSSTMLFAIKDAPTIAITSPVSGTPVATPVIATTFTPTVAGGRTINKYEVVVTQGSTTILDSGWITQTTPTGTGVAITYSSGVSGYKNDQVYSMLVKVQDSDGLEGSSTVAVSTHWVPPAAAAGVAADITQYNVEGAGYIRVTWNDTARDTAFVNWIVYRKDDEINPATLAVTKAGTWAPIGSVYVPAASYVYDDYAAPAGKKVNYYVSQVINKFGDLVESETITSVAVYPNSDGYWILMDTGSISLAIVTGDSYTDEYEESEVIIYGRGRYVDRGSYLGISGSLDVQLRDTGSTTARVKKQQLEDLKENFQNTYLRTPFGDIYKVSVGNIGVGRIAGVGASEFCDVTIPYSQVAE